MKKRIITLFTSLILVISLVSVLPAVTASAGDKYPTVTKYPDFDMDTYVAGLMTSDNPLNYSIKYRLNDQVIPSTIIKECMEDNKAFMTSLMAWKTLTFEPGNMTKDTVSEIGYYEAIALSVLKVSSQTDYVKDTLDNIVIKESSRFYKIYSSILKGTYGISDIYGKTFKDIKADAANDAFSEAFKKAYPKTAKASKFLDVFKIIVDSGKAIEESINNFCAYMACYELSDYMKQVIVDLYNNCDGAAYPYMKQALNMIKQASQSQEMAYDAAAFDLSSKGFSIVFEKATNDMFDAILAAEPLGQGVLIGRAIGKNVSNFLFNTDSTCEQYFKICAMYDFEKVLKNTVKKEMSNFTSQKTNYNANVLFSSIDALYALYDLGCDYAKEYADIIYSKSFAGPFLNDQYHYSEYLSELEGLRKLNNSWYEYTIKNSYLDYLSGDYPEIYDALMEEIDDSKTVHVTGISFPKNSVEWGTEDNVLYSSRASVTPSNADYKEINYKSSNENVVKYVNGYPYVVGVGTATVTATSVDGDRQAKLKVTVVNGHGTDGAQLLPADLNCESDYEYTVLSDGTIEITGYNGSATNLAIPATINGKKVTSIGYSAFYECTSLKNVTIQGSVTSIGRAAFCGCYSLTSITIPSSVTSIGAYAFASCESLTSITIPNSVTSIGEGAFNWCSSLTSITIPNSVTSIGDYAFESCYNLRSITIPNSVTSIGYDAFYNCTSLTSVTIPNSVTSIGKRVFELCYNLRSITIPSSVTSIGESAFKCCDNLKNVYYSGTQSQWKTISIGNYNDHLINATIHYVTPHTHSYTSKVTKQPTCTAAGVRTYTCSCGDSYTESIAATGHKYVDTVVAPTTSAQGYTLHECSVCGDSYKDNYTDKLVTTLGNVSGFKVTGTTASTISFSWNKVSDATGYIVYKKIDGKWNGVGTPTGTTYTDKNLTAGTTYNYRIRAYKKLSDGSKIYSGSFTTLDATTSLAAVTGLKVTGTTTNSVSLSWTAQNDATGYIVYRKIDGTWTGVGTPKISTYTDNNLTAATKYDYRIRAYKKLDDGSKIYSESFVNASATTANNTALANVTGFKVTGSTASTISFSWNKVSDATGYIVYRRINGSLTGVGTPTGTTFTDKNLGSNSKFEYAIRSYKKLSDGSKIYSASTTTLSAYTSLLTVSGFKVTESEAKSISLSWNAVKNVSGYIMYRKIDGKWTGIGTTTATTFTDTKDLYSGCTYEYAIRAYKKLDDGTKIYSESMKTLTTSTRPVSVTITVTAGTKKATVSWNKVSGATGYKVYYKDPSTGEWTLITTADKNTFSYTKTGLTSGKTYGLAVQSIRVVNGKTYSGKFVAKSVKVE